MHQFSVVTAFFFVIIRKKVQTEGEIGKVGPYTVSKHNHTVQRLTLSPHRSCPIAAADFQYTGVTGPKAKQIATNLFELERYLYE